MVFQRLIQAIVFVAALWVPLAASSVTVPFTEGFASDVANWTDNEGNPLTFNSAGGPDGGSYASSEFNYYEYFSPFGGGPVVLRASGLSNASGGAFIGNWSASGVTEVTAKVRHNSPVDLNFYMRVAASPSNYPGAIYPSMMSVAPNTWTDLSYSIAGVCIDEGVPCASVLANVGNLQFGTDAPAALLDDDVVYSIDIDLVSIVPEPGTASLMFMGFMGLAKFGRPRR
ncbi:hypothetical protein MK489_05700 [Myxococcota bacterium]|nr:hypothetical protein [Myxococcota bacterium]